jgi:hypothetical protein
MNMITTAGQPGAGGGLAGVGDWVDDLIQAGTPIATAAINLAAGVPANPWAGINPATGLPYGAAPTSGLGSLSIPMLLLLGVGAYFLLSGSGGSRRRS